MAFRPISLELNTRKVVIVGGGEIAIRRARYFSGTGAELYVYAIDVLGKVKSITPFVQCEPYSSGQVESAQVVIAATNNVELNRQICIDGRAVGALVNNVSDRSDCDFHIPAILESEQFTIAVKFRRGKFERSNRPSKSNSGDAP